MSVSEAQSVVRCSNLHPAIGRTCGLGCADTNRNGLLEINEVVTVVNNLLHGCPR